MGRSEVERRRMYIEQLEKVLYDGKNHPLTQMVKQCLQNAPSRRPTAQQLLMELERVKADIEGVYGELAKLDAVRQVVIVKNMQQKELEVRGKNDELRAKDEEIQRLQQQLEQVQVITLTVYYCMQVKFGPVHPLIS